MTVTGARRVLLIVVLLIGADACSIASSKDWRVAADVQGAIPQAIVVASDSESLAPLATGLPPLGIDLASHVAIGLALSGTTGYEMRVVDVTFAPRDRLVQPVIQLPKGPCSTVAIFRAVVVTVRRAALPPPPCTVRTKFTNCTQQCVGSSLVVESLTAP
jgi:hypothetical protein